MLGGAPAGAAIHDVKTHLPVRTGKGMGADFRERKFVDCFLAGEAGGEYQAGNTKLGKARQRRVRRAYFMRA